MPHPELDAEQAYIDQAYRCLAAMRDRTAAPPTSPTRRPRRSTRRSPRPTSTTGWPASTPTCRGSASAASTTRRRHVWYVGRRHVEDAGGDPVVVDWRAEVATPFYRATAADPLGLRRRRRFVMTGRRLDDLFDEVFDDPDSVDAAHHGGIPDPLLAELERERTGEMRDIVATIAGRAGRGHPGAARHAASSCRAARAPARPRSACTGPRSCSTSTGRRLDAEGVLVIGPEPDLPALHRPGAAVAGRDRHPPDHARAAARRHRLPGHGRRRRRRGRGEGRRPHGRGDRRGPWAPRCRPPDEGLAVATTWGDGPRRRRPTCAPPSSDVRARERAAQRRAGRAPHPARPARAGRPGAAAQRGGGTTEAVDADLRRDRAWAAAVDRLWPALSAPGAGAPAADQPGRPGGGRRRAARRPTSRRRSGGRRPAGSPTSRGPPPTWRCSTRPRPRSPARPAPTATSWWTRRRTCPRWRCGRWPGAAATALDDRARRPGPGDRTGGPGVVGDGHRRARRAADGAAGRPRPRLPGAGLDHGRGQRAAGRGGARRAPDAVGPDRRAAAGGASRSGDDAASAPRWARRGRGPGGRVRVGRPSSSRRGCARRSTPRWPASRPTRRVTVLDPPEAKGLEFDAVVVVEPAAIAGGTSRGLRLLYVALTRAVQELVVRPPAPLPRRPRPRPRLNPHALDGATLGCVSSGERDRPARRRLRPRPRGTRSAAGTDRAPCCRWAPAPWRSARST